MTDGAAALLKLATWLSPAFPVGAFSYSHGLEWAVEAGDVRDHDTLHDWLDHLLRHGAPRSDAILLIHAARDPDDEALADLAAALTPSRERRLETTAQGAAFAKAVAAAWPAPGLSDRPAPYPVAVGRAAGAHGIDPQAAASLFLHAFAGNLCAAAQRLVPLGQTDAQAVVAALAPVAQAVAAEAAAGSLDDLGGFALRSDIAAMRHETQGVRLFRT
jgi:urease accessory protein